MYYLYSSSGVKNKDETLSLLKIHQQAATHRFGILIVYNKYNLEIVAIIRVTNVISCTCIKLGFENKNKTPVQPTTSLPLSLHLLTLKSKVPARSNKMLQNIIKTSQTVKSLIGICLIKFNLYYDQKMQKSCHEHFKAFILTVDVASGERKTKPS